MPSKLMRVRAAVALLAAVLSIGGVAAAATGLLPTPAQPVADQASTSSDGAARGHAQGDAAVFTEGTSVNQVARGLCQAWRAGQGGNSGGREASAAFRALAAAAGGVDKIAAYCQTTTTNSAAAAGGATGPDPAGTASTGLCRAWRAGQGGNSGGREASAAFRALAAAAGGVDKIAAYCQGTTPGNDASHQQPTSPSAPTPPTTGPPPSTGHGGQGQGGPPTNS